MGENALVNMAAEQAVLAKLIQKPEAYLNAAQRLSPELFSNRAHQEIYRAIERAANATSDCAYDVFMVSEQLRISGQSMLSDTPVGEAAEPYLFTLQGFHVTGDLSIHMDNLLETAARRRIKQEAERMIAAIQNPALPVQDGVTPLISGIESAIAETMDGDSTVRNFGDVLNEFIERINNDTVVSRIPTGFDELDNNFLSGGLEPSRVLTIGARPGVGKTAFGLSVARYAALKRKKKVLFASFEMSPEQLMRRIVAAEATVKLETFNNPTGLSKTDREDLMIKLARAEYRLSSMVNLDPDDEKFDPSLGGLFFWDKAETTVHQFLLRAREMHRRGRVDMIILDYLQLLSFGGRVESRQLEVSAIMRAIKLAALDMKIPIVVLSQLNRGSASRTDHRPQLTDLRESGAIEQDSDHVLLLWREDLEGDRADEQLDNNVLDIAVEKNRDGRMGRLKLMSQLEYGRFADLAPDFASNNPW